MLFERQTSEQENVYREMNTMAVSGATVFFGTGRFARLPFGELAEAFHMQERVYNRSMETVDIQEAAELLPVCVLDLQPGKVFLNLGEYDLKKTDFDMEAFVAGYEWILYTIHRAVKAEVFVVSVLSDDPRVGELNRRLQVLAEDSGADFVDVTGALSLKNPELHIFDMMKFYIRSHPLRFADAMEMVGL